MSTSTATALWYLGRASGVVDLVLLTIVVGLGVATRSGRAMLGLPRFGISAIHRSASLLALAFLGVHVASLTLDPQAQLRWIDAVTPFGSRFRPLWTGLGTVTFDAVVALVVTSLLRHRIGRRVWRAIHWAAYAVWPFAVLHTLGDGTDASRVWLVGCVVVCALAMLALLGWRTSESYLDDTNRVAGTRLPANVIGRPRWR